MADFLRDVQTELFLLRKRVSTWVVLAVWLVLAICFAYVFPYISYRSNGAEGGPAAGGGGTDLVTLLPGQLVPTVIGGFAFYGGALALILGVLTFGSEFGWNTWKTLFTQRPGRMRIVFAKVAALGLALLPFAVGVFVAGGVASLIIAGVEGASMSGPAPVSLAEAILAGWFTLAVWAAIGVMLAVMTRGTSLAIGIGILYALVIEGTISVFANSISWLKPIVEGFMRANAYSLVEPLGTSGSAENGGPGGFSGPFVDPLQAFVVLALYLVVFLGISVWLMRRRDIA